MTITFKDASTPPKKTRPLTYGDLKPGDLFSFNNALYPTLLKTTDGHAHLLSGVTYQPWGSRFAAVRRFHVTATIDRVESEVEE